MRESKGTGGGEAAAPIHLLRNAPLPAAAGKHVSGGRPPGAPFFLFLFLFLSSISLFPRSLRAADDVVLPNENLVADGLPALPRSLAERSAPYMEFRAASFQDWNPIRPEMIILTRFADVPQLHRVKAPGAARTQLTFYGERVLGAAYRPKSADILFLKDVGGGEWFQLYLRDDASGKVKLLTDGKSRNTPGAFSPSGKWLAYQSTKRTGKSSDIFVMDPSDPATDRFLVEGNGERWAAADFSPDEKTLLVSEVISVNESRLWLVEVATGAKTLFTPDSKTPVSWGRSRFSKDGRTVFTITNQGSEWNRLAAVDVATRKLDVVAPGLSWDVETFDLSPDGSKIAYTVNEGGAETLHALDLATRKALPLPKLPYGTLGSVRWSPESRRIGFTLNSAKSPSDAWAFDTATGKLERWTESEVGGLDASAFVEPELISWKSFDGRSIAGFLYRPPASFAGPRPVIVNIHGGPEGQSQAGFLGRNNFFVNELGVAIIFPNVRGSTGYGKAFVDLDNAEKREDSVEDIGALLDWIASQPGLDKSRVMVTGGSYGGYMTLASMTHFNDRFRCAVDVVGISNWVTFLEHTEAYRRDQRRVEYGDERDPKMREFLQKISPLTSAARITRPMFIVAGKNDPRVPYTEAEQMVAAVRRNGASVWYLLGKDEGHGFSKKKNQDFQFLATLKFVEDNLLK
jgi:dipeptidyl aminopeptidase/acylaminoacyl peptidase